MVDGGQLQTERDLAGRVTADLKVAGFDDAVESVAAAQVSCIAASGLPWTAPWRQQA